MEDNNDDDELFVVFPEWPETVLGYLLHRAMHESPSDPKDWASDLILNEDPSAVQLRDDFGTLSAVCGPEVAPLKLLMGLVERFHLPDRVAQVSDAILFEQENELEKAKGKAKDLSPTTRTSPSGKDSDVINLT